MKKILKNNSKLHIIITALETILSIYILIYFNYADKLNYIESTKTKTPDLALLIQNMFTSTWWALIITMVILICIFKITSIIYKKEYLHFISILIWVLLLILSIDLTQKLTYNISNFAIFLPIILINIKAYFNQKKYIK